MGGEVVIICYNRSLFDPVVYVEVMNSNMSGLWIHTAAGLVFCTGFARDGNEGGMSLCMIPLDMLYIHCF